MWSIIVTNDSYANCQCYLNVIILIYCINVQ